MARVCMTTDVVVLCDHSTNETMKPVILALDRMTGKDLWRHTGEVSWISQYWPAALHAPTVGDLAAGPGLVIQGCEKDCQCLTEGWRNLKWDEADGFEEKMGWSFHLRAVHPLTGELIWSTQESLPTKYAGSSIFRNGVRPFARAGTTLWVKHRFANEFTSKEGEKKWMVKKTLKQKAQLVALDYRTGEILHQQTMGQSAQLLGQHAGCLLTREGTKLTCYR